MTNLLIGTNNALIGATVTASSEATGYEAANVLAGGRRDLWKPDAAGASHTVTFDLGTAAAVDFLALGRADLAIKAGALSGATLAYSDDDNTYATWHDAGALTAADLVGPNLGDYVYAGAISAAHRYWKLSLDYSANATPALAHCFFGTALDLGRDPVGFSVKRMRLQETQDKPVYEITISWAGVSYTKAMELKEQVLDRADFSPIVLLSDGYDDILNDHGCMWCKVISSSMPQQITNQNDITLAVREII